jgi:hypothetical protein
MTPSDSIGNVLLVGDLVMVQHGDNLQLALVQEIKEPTIITNPNPTQVQQPGFVVLNILPESIPFDPRRVSRMANITKVVVPPAMRVTPTKPQA